MGDDKILNNLSLAKAAEERKKQLESSSAEAQKEINAIQNDSPEYNDRHFHKLSQQDQKNCLIEYWESRKREMDSKAKKEMDNIRKLIKERT